MMHYCKVTHTHSFDFYYYVFFKGSDSPLPIKKVSLLYFSIRSIIGIYKYDIRAVN